jgi:hypothetical protein
MSPLSFGLGYHFPVPCDPYSRPLRFLDELAVELFESIVND